MADPTFEELEAAVETTREGSLERIDALNALAWALRHSQVARAHRVASRARQLAIEHGYALGRARAARTMAMSQSDLTQMKDIFTHAHEARTFFDEAGDGPGRAASRDFLASMHEFSGDLAGGLEFALDALAIAREIGDRVRQGYALSSVGGILTESGEYEQAIERLHEALALFEAEGDRSGTGAICSRLAKVLKRAGRTQEALAIAHRCVALGEETQNAYLPWAGMSVMAEVEADRGNLEEAERLYREGIESIPGEQGRSVLGAEGSIALARLMMRRGAFAEAEQQLHDALIRTGDESILATVRVTAHDALADLHEQQGRLADAIEHLHKARVLREQIAQQEARNKLAQIEVRAAMDAAKKDAEIHRLRFVELHAMQSKLVESEKMAILGKLAAGTAHELNTPLGVLRSNHELTATAAKRFLSLLQGHDELEARARRLSEVLESTRRGSDEAMARIAAITESFGRFTALDASERQRFDVREGLESACTLLAPTLQEGVELVRKFHEVPPVEGWPREVNHAFLTVLQNAAQAIDGAGTVTLETSRDGSHVVARIRDTGGGMGATQVARLFEVAFSDDGTRTKMRLGLSAAYATMQKHGGSITAESTPGEGTTMTFRFPLGEQDVPE
ncbi:MAG: tetratricopeptide repeat protein [Myxococcales bacterium]|nr:tetratricopeptide repeat protein [Myxococcales bacterium]